MKIVSLNTWGGRAGREPLLDFFRRHADTVDVFCLQEVWAAPYEKYDGILAGGVPLSNAHTMTHALHDISTVLPNHQAFFRTSFEENYGLCTFVRKEYVVQEEGDVFVYGERGFVPTDDLGRHARNVQYVTIATDAGPRTVLNFHGLWNGKGKTDSSERLAQSDKLVAFLNTLEQPFVLCGDFNLLPDTESLKRIEAIGLHNCITENNITSTRTSFYKKEPKFADYIFTSPGIETQSFAVLPDEVSDHAPLCIVCV